jgi:hypothetical protein
MRLVLSFGTTLTKTEFDEAFKTHLGSLTMDDCQDGVDVSATESDVEDTDKDSNDAALPTALYTKEERALRQRHFPCSLCREPADGSHPSMRQLLRTCACDLCVPFSRF